MESLIGGPKQDPPRPSGKAPAPPAAEACGCERVGNCRIVLRHAPGRGSTNSGRRPERRLRGSDSPGAESMFSKVCGGISGRYQPRPGRPARSAPWRERAAASGRAGMARHRSSGRGINHFRGLQQFSGEFPRGPSASKGFAGCQTAVRACGSSRAQSKHHRRYFCFSQDISRCVSVSV